jgi:hypothetical protein
MNFEKKKTRHTLPDDSDSFASFTVQFIGRNFASYAWSHVGRAKLIRRLEENFFTSIIRCCLPPLSYDLHKKKQNEHNE